jgi:hypothetical protein
MPNEAIVKAVDDMIRNGAIASTARSAAIDHFERELQGQILMGSDYTRKTQELARQRQEAQAAVAAEQAKVQAERARLQQWEQQAKGELEEYGRIAKQMPVMASKLAAYEQIIKDYNIPPDQVVVPPVVPNDPPTPKPNMTQPTNPTTTNANWLSRDEALGYLRDLTQLNGSAFKIQAEHMKLYGEPLSEDLVTHQLSTGQSMEEYWRVKYGVDAKRAEIAARDKEAERAKIREEERAALMQQYAGDPTRFAGAPAPGQYMPVGGLTPQLEQFSSSRALAHSQNHANDQLAAPGADSFVPPEKRPDIAMQRERISNAVNAFYKNFDITGTPISEQGKQWSDRYRDVG